MGCTYEVFNMNVSNHAKECRNLFLKFFGDDFYFIDIPEDWNGEDDIDDIDEDMLNCQINEDNSGSLSFDSEPFFKCCGMEESVLDFFVLFCAKFQDVEADFNYYTEFSIDASSEYLDYRYKDGIVEGSTVYGCGPSFFFECPNCGYNPANDETLSSEPLFEIEDFDPNETYRCPECGTEIETGDWDKEYETISVQEFIDDSDEEFKEKYGL